MVTVLMPGQSDETACVRISAALSEVTKQKLKFVNFALRITNFFLVQRISHWMFT